MPQGLKAGYQTHWTTFGSGARSALMIHCALASSEAWRALARHLADHLTMTCFDMPGHGSSADWSGTGDILEETADVAAAFVADDPIDLIGHSFGAVVALRTAMARPDMIRTLTLIEPVFFAASLPENSDAMREHLKRSAGFGEALRAGRFHEAARLFTDIWGGGIPFLAMSKRDQDEMAARMRLIEASEDALFHDTSNMLSPDHLARLAMPVLLIEGNKAPPIIHAVCKSLKDRIEQARLVTVDGAGHMAPLTHAGAVAKEMLAFLK